jgi:hypothetical protein
MLIPCSSGTLEVVAVYSKDMEIAVSSTSASAAKCLISFSFDCQKRSAVSGIVSALYVSH